MNRILFRVFCAIFLAITGLVPHGAAQPADTGRDARRDGAADASASARETPRATIKTFFEAMQAYRSGNEGKLPEAVECLYLGEGLTDEEKLNQGGGPAHTLFAALDSLQFDLASITDEPGGSDYTATIGADDNPLELHLHRYEDDGLWRISSRTLAPEYLAEVAQRVEARASAAEQGEVTFQDKLRSPRATMETFIKGMNEVDGYTRADAIDTLDLSSVSPVDRKTVGERKAADLKAVIDRVKPVEFTQIPPESAGASYVYFQDPAGLGSIALAPVRASEEVPEERAWRFTQGTLERLESLYLTYKDRPPVAGAAEQGGTGPWANRIRDWIHAYHPALMDAPVYLRNYQWLGLLVLIGLGVIFSRLLTLFLGLFIQFWFRRKNYSYETRLERDFIRPIRVTLMAWVWWIGLSLLGLDPGVLEHLRVAAFLVTAAGAVWASYRLVDIIGQYMTERALESPSKHDDLLVPIIVRTLKIVVIVVGLVAFAFQVNENPASLLTGLGLGGLALALAAKDVVANIFGSVTILTDRPFCIGDWITMGDIDGIVESVGIRSTRIRTFHDSLITVPNSAITDTHIDNLGQRRYRRVQATLSVAYNTPPDAIEAFCEGVRELIRQHPYTRKDYYHAYFHGFGDSSLDILLYCFVETPDWATELRERHRLLLDIVRLARSLGVEFAFPTRTLYMRQEATPPPDAASAEPDAARSKGRDAAREIAAQSLDPGGKIPPPSPFSDGGDGDFLTKEETESYE